MRELALEIELNFLDLLRIALSEKNDAKSLKKSREIKILEEIIPGLTSPAYAPLLLAVQKALYQISLEYLDQIKVKLSEANPNSEKLQKKLKKESRKKLAEIIGHALKRLPLENSKREKTLSTFISWTKNAIQRVLVEVKALPFANILTPLINYDNATKTATGLSLVGASLVMKLMDNYETDSSPNHTYQLSSQLESSLSIIVTNDLNRLSNDIQKKVIFWIKVVEAAHSIGDTHSISAIFPCLLAFNIPIESTRITEAVKKLDKTAMPTYYKLQELYDLSSEKPEGLVQLKLSETVSPHLSSFHGAAIGWQETLNKAAAKESIKTSLAKASINAEAYIALLDYPHKETTITAITNLLNNPTWATEEQPMQPHSPPPTARSLDETTTTLTNSSSLFFQDAKKERARKAHSVHLTSSPTPSSSNSKN